MVTPDPEEDFTLADRRFMDAAVRHSYAHLGLTGENPAVGAMVVAETDAGPAIVGRGVTALGGRPHAELQALAEAGPLAAGATAYVTLEPCSHLGKSPPCAEALITAGVRRVVVAVLDPDIRVAGRGVAILRKAGIAVDIGCEATAARRAMAGFLSLKGRGRPFLSLKMAVSADGRIGRRGAGQVPISGAVAHDVAHVLRLEHEAVMVGVGTAAEDDPQLTVRLPGLGERSPLRVVIDPFARLSPDAAMLRGGRPVLVLASAKAPVRAVAGLRAAGARVDELASDYRGRFAPAEILRHLGLLGIKSVLLEGGADTARRFLEAGLVDRCIIVRAPTVVGEDGVAAPMLPDAAGPDFVLVGRRALGEDEMLEFERKA